MLLNKFPWLTKYEVKLDGKELWNIKSNKIVEFNLTELCGEQLSINMNFIYQKVW
jgi:hypothetical protein